MLTSITYYRTFQAISTKVWAHVINLSPKVDGTNIFPTEQNLGVLTSGALSISLFRPQFRVPLGRVYTSVPSKGEQVYLEQGFILGIYGARVVKTG